MCASLVAPSPLRVAVTGHRPADLFGWDRGAEGWQWLRGVLSGLLRELGAAEAISGLALGVDQLFALAARDAGVPVAAYVPFEGQDRKWLAPDRRAYAEMRAQASRTVVCRALTPGPDGEFAFRDVVEALHARNGRMVEDCDVIIAVWTGKTSGGTYDAVQKAMRAGRVLVHVDPAARTATIVA
jgi:uncharacterized phage-like protein YoqJ